jgi:hypothetical protein
MSYSTVNGVVVSTRMAQSTDRGATWTYVGDVNTPSAATVTTSDTAVCDAGTCSGTTVHEVSSLVVDTGDPDSTRALKVFAHTYFTNPALHYEIGDIDVYTAPAAAGPWTRTKLLGWPSSSPESTSGVAQDIATDAKLAGLAGCTVLTEPGAIVRGASLDLALGCLRGDGTIEVVLLRSTDHAQSFSYVSTLLTASDAAALGAPMRRINAADLFTVGGASYLVATPDGPVNVGAATIDGYTGCLVFPFADVTAGTLARCAGAPVVLSSYERATGRFAGACTAAEGATAAGMIVPIADLTSATRFHVYDTGRPPP